tara:strand:- start:2749 stop:3858 length:1110 start_codon:yes stop_codon:yes gene_type:complete
MTILHISGARSWGGNEQQIVDLIPELKKLNVENIVYGIKNSPLHKFLSDTDTMFLCAKEKKISKKGNLGQLKKISQKYNPDIIHLHTSDSATLFVLTDLIHRIKIPAILSKKGMGKSMSLLSLYKYNYKNIKKIICVSKAVKWDLQKKVIREENHNKLEVVYDGVNLDRTKVVRTENLQKMFNILAGFKILGNIANHTTAKDLGVLVKTMDHLVNKLNVKDVHLVQIGEFSKLTPELKSQIINLNLESYITLGGFQKNAVDFIPQFDIYVMSSEREGLPITIFEAFYKKTPVVSTKAGGIPEAIEDGVNGYLADIKDYKMLAKKIALLLNDNDLKLQFIEKSEVIFFNKFVASITAKNTFEIYNKVISL